MQIRNDAGMFDVSHMTIVDIQGEQAQAFLQKLVANDVAKLTVPGKALYTPMLNEQGGVIDDLIIYFFSNTSYRLVVNSATREKDLAHLAKISADFAVTVTERNEFGMIAVQGPNAKAKTATLLTAEQNAAIEGMKPFFGVQTGDLFIATTGYTGEDGYEIVVPKEQAADLLRTTVRRRSCTSRFRRTRHATFRSGHEPLWPRYRRKRIATSG